MNEEFPGQKRPGGPVKFKPIEADGNFYDPEHPPKMMTDVATGEVKYEGGKIISKDEAYSVMFWQNNEVPGLKEAMVESVQKGIQTGEFGAFIGGEKTDKGFELDQKSKEKLSAYRVLAQELGYVIGPYKYNESVGNVMATIKKSEEIA